MENIVVSVLCHTFNHSDFIQKALDGFIMQKTDFNFEICIHDDASTDGTQDIIKQYALKYPDLIKPIYQSINQYSQGKSVYEINRTRAKGKYIAICEGDDYWIDSSKLQKQVEILDNDPKCSCVGHACYIQNTRNPFARKIWRIGSKVRVLSVTEIIENRGSVFPFHSFMFRNETIEMPDFFKSFKVGDVTRLMYFSLIGHVVFIPNAMSVYRVGVDLSWNQRVRMNTQKIIEHYQSEIQFFKDINTYTNHEYDESVNKVINRLEYIMLVRKRDFETIKQNKYKLISNKSVYSRLTLFVEHYFPKLFDGLRFLRFKYWV